MKYLKTFESLNKLQSPIYEIKFLISEFTSDDDPINEDQFKRQLEHVFKKYLLNIKSIEEFTSEIINKLDTDKDIILIILNTFRKFFNKYLVD